jgi:aquaporin Z
MSDDIRKYLAEILGTFTLVFVGTTTILSTQGSSAFDVTVGLAFGLALLAGLYAFAEVSGGHFNPIVSIAMVLDRRLDAKHLIPYWLAQFAGAVVASLCVAIAFSRDAVKLTATVPGPQGAGTAFFLEVLATAIFVIVILVSTASERHGGTALIAIPLTLAAAHFALIPWSGSSLNTARSFGPALIGNRWTDFWVYIVGPPLGAILGWAIYAFVIKTREAAAPAPASPSQR